MDPETAAACDAYAEQLANEHPPISDAVADAAAALLAAYTEPEEPADAAAV